MRLVMSVLLLGAVVGACSDTLGSTLGGKWVEVEAQQVPGNSFDMTLRASGSNVSGSGTWCGELLGCRAVTVSGTASGNAIHLDIVYDNGLIVHFDGRISMLSVLDGSAIGEFPGQPPQLPHAVTYRRA